MLIAATVTSTASSHVVEVRTEDSRQSLPVSAKPSGGGSAVNGDEFLMLALATCYCNDLYREAARLNIEIASVHVEARADFPGVGLAANKIKYKADIQSLASQAEIDRLLKETDAVAEVHNTVRYGVPVVLRVS